MLDLDFGVEQLNELFTQHVFNLEQEVVYFPIRHHSPACSYHLLQVFEQYNPEIVLIEGPELANKLIPVLADEATRPPVSLYYSYQDEQNPNKRASFYYPMLQFSPEYVVLKQASKQGIAVQFIDLNFRPKNDDTLVKLTKTSFQDESLLADSQFMTSLCHKLHCRGFNELWEKVFEIEGITKTPTAFAQEVFTYCTLSRLCYTDEQLAEEGHLAREAFMRNCIERAKGSYKRTLVVTGGFHTYGLVTPPTLNQSGSAVAALSGANTNEQQGEEQIYPMVYTFQEADQLNGYASGMPYVNYYQQIWKQLSARKPTEVFKQSNLFIISTLSKELRKNEESISTSDGIEAYAMIQGLAQLRHKREGGVYELQDGIRTAFVKGEDSFANVKPLELLSTLLTGNEIGEVAPNEFIPPIVKDFKESCSNLKLHMKTTGQHRKQLDLYSNEKHRKISHLLHCASYLDVGFATKKSGPDFVNYIDIHRVRENWTYTYTSLVEARLVEYASYGGTVKEAVMRKMEEELAQIPSHQSKEYAKKLMESHRMGLEALSESLYIALKEALLQDGSFLSLCGTLSILNHMYSHRSLLGISDESSLVPLLTQGYEQAVSRLHQIYRSQPDEHRQCIQALKTLGMLAKRDEANFDQERLLDDLASLLQLPDLAPMLEGACIAILAQAYHSRRPEIVTRASSYMLGTPEKVKLISSYLQGVFATARDVLLYDDVLLKSLNELFMTLSHEQFIEMSPELRLAFTNFTAAEVNLIMKQIAGFHQVDVTVLEEKGISEALLVEAKAQDEAVRREFAKWSLI
ncbi:DUF5682 family protein [Paenibacillus turicensis]|uniref:DUF5682 family protein n=1 Tax=Paenibacillus turicensis TaxID=160487 RepID=UPI003D2BB472